MKMPILHDMSVHYLEDSEDSRIYAFQWESSQHQRSIQRAMNEMLYNIEGVEVIMDDILVHGTTIEDHNKKLQEALKRCREKNWKLNSKQSKTVHARTRVHLSQVD